jgi:hypothetical protein
MRLIFEGELDVVGQESGYASPAIRIGEKDLGQELENYGGKVRVIVESIPQWTATAPTAPGLYWFFGWLYKSWQKDFPPELNLAKMKMVGGTLVMIANGAFIWPREIGTGVWCDVILPVLAKGTDYA